MDNPDPADGEPLTRPEVEVSLASSIVAIFYRQFDGFDNSST